MLFRSAWNDFNVFEFTKARFMAQDVIYPGEGSVSGHCKWILYHWALGEASQGSVGDAN